MFFQPFRMGLWLLRYISLSQRCEPQIIIWAIIKKRIRRRQCSIVKPEVRQITINKRPSVNYLFITISLVSSFPLSFLPSFLLSNSSQQNLQPSIILYIRTSPVSKELSEVSQRSVSSWSSAPYITSCHPAAGCRLPAPLWPALTLITPTICYLKKLPENSVLKTSDLCLLRGI